MQRILMILFLLTMCICPIANAMTLAIFDFTDAEGRESENGKRISMMVFARISSRNIPELQLIERAEIEKIMKEQNLNANGLVGTSSGILKLGKLLGAEFIMTGKAFYLNDDFVINAKIIDCKSGKVKGLSLSFDKESDTNSIHETSAEKIAKQVEEDLSGKKNAGK